MRFAPSAVLADVSRSARTTKLGVALPRRWLLASRPLAVALRALGLFALFSFALGLSGCFPTVYGAHEEWVLWPHGAPGALGESEPDRPRIFLFEPRPGRANGVGVVVASGGSYGHHGGLISEGVATAQWLSARGFTAALVRYRVGEVGGYGHRSMLADVERGVRLLRHRAGSLGLRTIGVVGYSAGGHAAGWLATRCRADAPRRTVADPIDGEPCHVDFAVMVYPVVTMFPPDVHERSRDNLLRDVPELDRASALHDLSLEEHVHRQMPPTLLVHSDLDGKVPVGNSVRFFERGRAAGADVTLLRYADGGHGVALAHGIAQMGTWPSRFLTWLRARRTLATQPIAPGPR